MLSNTSFVLSDSLTTGQITFIARVVIQLFSYLGIYLLGLIVLSNAPRLASFETHDVLNRFVGQSSTLVVTLRWMWNGIRARRREPTSLALGLALTLALLYGLTVSLSDIGLIGIHSCTIPGPSYEDFPASVRFNGDALALINQNILNGTDPSTINLYRCDAATTIANLTLPHNNGVLPEARVCTDLHNSTLADGSAFLDLNSTDSDTLMPKYLFSNSDFLGNWYLAAPTGKSVLEPTINGGLAVIPNDFGVQMIAGVPQLSPQERVDIGKTMGLEIEVGCLSLGITVSTNLTFRSAEFTPDSEYLPNRMNPPNYSGPDNLQSPLMKAADRIRAAYSSKQSSSNLGEGLSSFQLQVFTLNIADFQSGTSGEDILQDCTSDIQNSLNVAGGPESGLKFAANQTICQVIGLAGAQPGNSLFTKTLETMVCATTTQVNMLSAVISVDKNGSVTSDVTRLPSNLNAVQALFYNQSDSNADYDPSSFAPIIRFTLSDNSAGGTQHYIYQGAQIAAIDSPGSFYQGSGNAGALFLQTAPNIWATTAWPGIGLIDSSILVANFSAGQVTKWAGQVGASFILGSMGYNGWAARGAQSLTVVSTGGYPATCFSSWYAFGFLPLLFALLSVLCWILVLWITARFNEARRHQKKYGGLVPHIDLPSPERISPNTMLEWADRPEPHLRPAQEKFYLNADSDSSSMIMGPAP